MTDLREECAELAGVALHTALNSLQVAEAQRAAGRLRHAVVALEQAAVQLGRADSLVEFCGLEPTLGVTQLFARVAVVRDQLAQDCEKGWKAGLSGQIDPHEALRKWRKPLPPQKGGAQGGKKGKKGYDRKRDKHRKEGE